MKTMLLFLFTCCACFSFAQPGTVSPSIQPQKQKCLGGSGVDEAFCIQQTKDGGYIVAGYSTSNDGDVSGHHGRTDIHDYWVVKLDHLSNIQWQKSFGGSGSDVASSIQQTKDGGYIVAGYSDSYDGDVSGHHGAYDYWILKLDSSGAIQWQKSLGGAASDYAQNIQQTKDGGYIVAGYSDSDDGDVSGNHGVYDYWIIKIDSSGAIQWQKSLGGSRVDFAISIQQARDGGYIVAGYSDSNDDNVSGNHGGNDYWIVKLNRAGNIQWQKCLGGLSYDLAYSVQQINDGGYIVAGWSYSNDGDVSGNHGSADYWIVKLDSIGIIQWQKCLGGSNGDYAQSIRQTTDSGYIVAGLSQSNDGDVSGHHGNAFHADSWIVKLNSSGIIQWKKSFGGSRDDGALSIQQTREGGYIVAGWSQSNDGDVSGNHGGDDYWIVKLKPLDLSLLTQLQVQANPLQNKTVLLSFCCNEEADQNFVVEKSKDGIQFISAGAVNAKQAIQSTSSYSFIDNTPFTGHSYYRLKQTDVDGNSSYSNIVTIKISNDVYNISVQPNPSHNGIFTADLKEVKKNIAIIVTDNSGKKVYTNTILSAQQIKIALGNKPKGLYYLQVSYDGGKETVKLIVE